MEIALIIFGCLCVLVLLYLNVISTLCVCLDPELEPVQKWGQSVVIWVVPFIGSSLILHFVNDHSPEVIERFYIPWVFKSIVLGTPIRKGTNDNTGEEMPGVHGSGLDGGSGGDAGGSD